MKKWTIISVFIILTTAAGVLVWLFLKPAPGFACGVACHGKEFGIATDPPRSFLKMSNMAPGERVSAGLAVLNAGDLDFSYAVSASLQEGDAGLYGLMLLELVDADGVLRYNGPLSGLNKMDIGTLPKGEREVLHFTVTLPLSAGNDLQNKTAKAMFIFTARSHDGDICPGGKVIFEPPVSNRHFKLKTGSAVPIKFHLVKPDGGPDRSLHPGVVLLVGGPGQDGAPVMYTFKLSDGTLRFDNRLLLPHYIAVFSTKTCQVQPHGRYSARVMENGAELGTITFQADNSPGTARSNGHNGRD